MTYDVNVVTCPIVEVTVKDNSGKTPLEVCEAFKLNDWMLAQRILTNPESTLQTMVLQKINVYVDGFLDSCIESGLGFMLCVGCWSVTTTRQASACAH